ncbi:MAG: hypothetical protein RL332_499, partial [Actinomycetota bacterium]
CLAIDAEGNTIDGDYILAILAQGFKSRAKLKDSTVVATVMSNLGFLIAMKDAGISVAKTAVGDRYVLENMLENNYTLGGEQSGHIIMREFSGTGDGLLTALQLLCEMARSKKSLKELSSIMQRFPQVLINVSDVSKDNCAHQVQNPSSESWLKPKVIASPKKLQKNLPKLLKKN